MMSKLTEQIASEEKEARIKELHRLKYWCKNCDKLFSDIEVLHTGSGKMCQKCGKEIIEKK